MSRASPINEPDYEVVGAADIAGASPSVASRSRSTTSAGHTAASRARSPSTAELDPLKENDESFNLKFEAFKAGLQERYALEPSAPPATDMFTGAGTGTASATTSPQKQPGEASPPTKPYASPYQINVHGPGFSPSASPIVVPGSAPSSASGIDSKHHIRSASGEPGSFAAAAAASAAAASLSPPLLYGGPGEGAHAHVTQQYQQIEGSPNPSPVFGASAAGQVEGQSGGAAFYEPVMSRRKVSGADLNTTAGETGLDAFEVQKLAEAKDEDFQEKKKNDRAAKRRRIKKRMERWNTTLRLKYPILHWMETKTGINKVYIVLAAIVVLFAMAFFGLGINHLSDLVGFSYPVFRSYKCLEKPTETRDELRYWLVYWIVFGLFGTVEAMTDTFLSWVPFYYPTKLAFLMWCFLPQSKGAQSVYDSIVRPALSAHESKIDSGLDSVRAAAGRTVSEVGSAAVRSVRSKSQQFSAAFKQKLVDSIAQQAGAAIGVALAGGGAGAGAGAGAASAPVSPAPEPEPEPEVPRHHGPEDAGGPDNRM